MNSNGNEWQSICIINDFNALKLCNVSYEMHIQIPRATYSLVQVLISGNLKWNSTGIIEHIFIDCNVHQVIRMRTICIINVSMLSKYFTIILSNTISGYLLWKKSTHFLILHSLNIMTNYKLILSSVLSSIF